MTEQEEFEFRLRLEQEQAARPATGYTLNNARRFLLSSPVGAVARGVKDVIDTGAEFISGLGGQGEQARVRAMNEAGKADFAQATQALGAPPAVLPAGARIGGNVLATLPAVTGVGSLVGMAAPRLGAAISSGGMTTGAAPVGGMARLGDMAIRVGGGGIGGGIAAGMVNPEDAGTGAAIGAALPPALRIAGGAGQAVGGMLRPNINNPELARRAIDQGIPLGPADISASRGTKALRSVLNDAPFVGGIGERQGEAVQRGFNRAVGRTFGAEADSLTPEVLDAAKKRMGDEFQRIWGRNVVAVDDTLMRQLTDLQSRAAKLPRSEGASLESEIQDLLGKMTSGADGAVVIPGDVANKFQSYIRRRAEGSQGLKNELSELRQAIISAFNRGVSPEDAAALSGNRRQYKAFKTVEPLLQSAEAGVAGRTPGDIPAGLLPQAVRQSYRSGIAGSPFEDLTQIGSQYVADRVARTGGSARAMIQNSALGGGLALGAYANPLTLAAVPVSAGLQRALGSPALANRLLELQGRDGATVNALARLLEQQAYRAGPVIAADR